MAGPDVVEEQDTLRFITCGSVDDGKSTLIGRLLWETGQLYDDQLDSLRSDSARHGTQGASLDFALLLDGLEAEREQGITIDVAYRFFSTPTRRFIVADTPGHAQYTRNMVTGASTADTAVLLVDARYGLQTQTLRHIRLVALMGVRHVALAINKIDLVPDVQDVFDATRAAFHAFADPLGFTGVQAIPVSALHGDNVVQSSTRTPWYKGPSLLAYLAAVDATSSMAGGFVFPVQWVNRPDADFRGYSGTVVRGRVQVGDAVRVTASGQVTAVSEILTADGTRAHAQAGDAVTLRLCDAVDVARGDVLSLQDAPLQTTDHFEATLVWLHEEPGLAGRRYDIKLATQWTGASITTVKHRVEIDTGKPGAATSLQLNDIAVCTLATHHPLTFDTYRDCRALGAFILVDHTSHATVAAGMVRHDLRRAQNVHRQALTIGRVDREALHGHRGRVVWFTGLSGSGKSTIANALEVALHARGRRTYILDGDNVRQGLNRDLGFTDADRVENIRRVAEVARLMLDAGLIVLTAFISPFAREREMARELVGAAHFLEVHVNTSLAVCEARDPKGLYRKARRGELPNMTGIHSVYEPPERPDLVLGGDSASVNAMVEILLSELEARDEVDGA
jgi:bifunctional enzyme CysN/CysC